MSTVYEFPSQWYRFATAKFRLQARSQMSPRPWIGGKSIYGPHAQIWLAELSMTPVTDPDRQQIAAFFSRLDGQAGLLRIADPSRLRPWYDRSIISPAETTWTDGTKWSDGTFWSSDFLPPSIYVATAASKGDNYMVLGGLPASLSGALMHGDLLQINPDGIAGSVPNLYETSIGGATDASGKIGVEIRPRLRQNLAVGDQVALRFPSSVFRLVDDDQGVFEVTPPVFGDMSFSLVEAMDQVA